MQNLFCRLTKSVNKPKRSQYSQSQNRDRDSLREIRRESQRTEERFVPQVGWNRKRQVAVIF